MTTKRIDYIDISKWLGISLVIFGHMKMPNELLQWIYAFHMPLFFVISGYTYRPQPFDKQFLIKKIKTIYIPFLLFALIFCKGDFSSYVYIAFGSRNALEIANTYTVLWFLPCFFLSVLLFSILINISNKTTNKRQHVAIWGGVIILLMLTKICLQVKETHPIIAKYGYPLNFDMAMVGTIFMVAGYYFKRIINWLNSQKHWGLIITTIAIFIITSFSAFTNLPQSLNPTSPHVEMSIGALGNWWLFFFNASTMSFATIGLSVLTDNLIKQKKLLIFIGQNSLTILCIHGIILLAVSKILPIIGLTGIDNFSLLLRGIISYLIVITASIPIILLIKRFAPNLVGK